MTQGRGLARIILIAAMIAGASYLYVVANPLHGPLAVTWKGAGVSLLAVYAALQARNVDGWLIALVMVFGAIGDVLLDAQGLLEGAAAFLVGHIVAIILYLRNRRNALSLSQKWLATLVLPLAVLIAVWSVPIESRPIVGIYTGFVAAMAAAAWISRFPRYRTGIGAMMFVASDLLIFARMGPLAADSWVGFAVWGLYFGGQLLIVLGVTRTLASEDPARA